ncbi:MAG: VOC family protein [Firmicutes bacterium]|nr:VOC family protein [Bacillota bacterium]
MKMCHVTINVSDLEKSIKFYEDVLKIKVLGDMRGMGMPIVFLGEEEKDVKVELIGNKENAFKGSGISAGFHVADLDAAYEEVKNMGYQVSPMVSPNPNVRFFFVSDPDGFQIQLI